MPIIDIIAGARPNFMKIGPIIRALESRRATGGAGADEGRGLEYRLLHTGQHYDVRMSGEFFTQLGLPQPHLNLEVGSGTQAEQTATIMVRYEAAIAEMKPDLCLVVGDVNSTMACAIVAKKAGVRVAHVEAGIRSGDWSMPEEINRIVTDAVADFFFTTSEVANANLRRSGVADSRIFFVGNTMIDSLLMNIDKLYPPAIWGEWDLQAKEYFVLTLHRPANVDAISRLQAMLDAIGRGCRRLPVVFPVHPRTQKMLAGLSVPGNIRRTDPLGYLEFNYLVRSAKAVITDSGGITEEATVMGVPCLTLRDSTERPETVTVGTNVLVGTDPAMLAPELDTLFAGGWKRGGVPEKWDGKAGERIVSALAKVLGESSG